MSHSGAVVGDRSLQPVAYYRLIKASERMPNSWHHATKMSHLPHRKYKYGLCCNPPTSEWCSRTFQGYLNSAEKKTHQKTDKTGSKAHQGTVVPKKTKQKSGQMELNMQQFQKVACFTGSQWSSLFTAFLLSRSSRLYGWVCPHCNQSQETPDAHRN